jgi:tRNA A-37 threonylcarbamoyl transferase component Bud32
LPGKLGPYEIRSELGRGAMAQVWRAYDPVLDREVAIKEPLLPKAVDSTMAAEFGARFVREGRAAAKLNHPGIVTIHAADIYEGRAALVMELVDGQTLGEMLGRGPLDKKLALSLMEQLLSAAGYAHARGIVHRDIKPDNIFINRDHQAKLADFGIASLASDSTLTQAGTIMGTPGYMAPEQITGGTVDARADLFSLGVVFYEMLTGNNPFGATEGLPATTVMYRIVHQAPPELTPEALTGLPPQLRSVLEAALAKDPDDRFPDAASFLAALKGEGPLPVPGSSRPAGAALPAAHAGGTILGRLSAIKSATMISRPSSGKQEATWRRSWVPYAAVVAVGLIVMIALLVSAKGGGGSAALVLESTTATTAAPVAQMDGGEDWPGWTAWTVMIKNYSASTPDGERLAKEFRDSCRAKGLDCGVIKSSNYSSLKPGWWAVYTGVFSTKSEASAWRVKVISWGFPSDAYLRQVKR